VDEVAIRGAVLLIIAATATIAGEGELEGSSRKAKQRAKGNAE
jgi:hypothetical protein